MAARTPLSRADRRKEGSPYARATVSAPSTPRGGVRSFLSSLLWGTPKPQPESEEEQDDLEGQDLTIEAVSDEDDMSPQAPVSAPIAATRGWNDPPFPSAASSAGTFGQAGPPPGAFSAQQQQGRQRQAEREPSIASNTANERLEDFFRGKRERGETLTPEEAASVVQLMGEAQMASPPPQTQVPSSAFTFRAQTPKSTSFYNRSFPSSSNLRTLGGLSSSASLPSLSSLNLPAANSSQPQSAPFNKTIPNRAPRNIYLGPGYSSASVAARRRRLAQTNALLNPSGMRKSDSESALSQYTSDDRRADFEQPVSKRRKVEAEREEPVQQAPKQYKPVTTPMSAFVAKNTPVRPSPLSRPITPKESPSPAKADPSPPKTTTRAANMMLDIIKDAEAEAQPNAKNKEFMNPFDRDDSALARIPQTRSRSKASNGETPEKTPAATPRRKTRAGKASPAPSREAIIRSTSSKPMSVKERLEKSMPPEYRQALARAAESPKQDPELTKKATKKARVEEPQPIEEPEEEQEVPASVEKPEPAAKQSNGKTKEKSAEPSSKASKPPPSKSKGKPPTKGTAVFEVDDSTEDEEEISSTLKPDQGRAAEKPKEVMPATPTFSFSAPPPPAPVSAFIPALKSTPSPSLTPTASPSPAPEDPKAAAMAILASSLPKFDFKVNQGVKASWPDGSEQKQALQMSRDQLPKFKLLA